MLLSAGLTIDDDDADSLMLEMVQMWFCCPRRSSNNNNQTSHSIGRSSQRLPHAAADGDVVVVLVLISGCPLFVAISFLQPCSSKGIEFAVRQILLVLKLEDPMN
mmetsp:Transcript_61897/g.151302  ORF Transcript_61897/g.151302 Transcript_61897/m.151302 type:complete len:105 (-) Transcript_61897:158-472(-)